MRVLRVYHGGRDSAQRARERALQSAGVDVVLVVPGAWEAEVVVQGTESFRLVELPISRPGDVNRHFVTDRIAIRRTLDLAAPDVLDIHEEPFSIATRQWLRAAPPDLPIVVYTAQNIDKRLPPPFAQYEKAAYRRAAALYPCSRQAASVARGKGFAGLIDVLPLGYDDTIIRPGSQSVHDVEVLLGLVGRLVPEKGGLDAVEILARLNEVRPTRLVVAGSGPDSDSIARLAAARGVSTQLEFIGWQSPQQLATLYSALHFVLVPSRATETWAEQFGRVIVEGQASGAIVAGYASGAIPEVAGEAALLAEVGDITTLSRRVIDVLADPGAFERHRQLGITLSATRTWSRVAARQAELYRRVITGEWVQCELVRSPHVRRVAARAEFGATAPTVAGTRPFALPALRRGGCLASTLAGVIDLGAEIWATLASKRG